MTSYNFFSTTARGWLYLLTFINQVSLYFMNTLTQGTGSFRATYTSMVFNIALNFLILLFIIWNQKTIMAESYGKESQKPFHQWVWFECSTVEKWGISFAFFSWMIPNFINLFYLHGLGFLLGGFFIISLFYWFIIIGVMVRSYKKYQPILTSPNTV